MKWFGYGLLCLTCACSQTSTQQLLDLNIPGIDRIPPALVSPANNSKSVGLNVSFSWSSRIAGSTYVLQVATDPAFQNIISGGRVETRDTTASVTLPDALTFYWRVRSKLSPENTFSSTYTLHAFDNAVYVYCPAGATCSNSGRVGNKTSPYQVIVDSMAEAKTLGLNLHVASRDGSSFYPEIITIVRGLNVYGGFNGATWERNISANPTEIRYDTSAVLIGIGLVSNAAYVFDGFTITNSTTSVANSTAVDLINTDGKFTVSNCKINAGQVSGSAVYAVRYSNAHAQLKNNSINGGMGNYIAVNITASSNPIIDGNYIFGGTGNGGGNALAVNNSVPTITNNVIHGGLSGTAQQIFTISLSGSSGAPIRPAISNNTIVVGLAGISSTGIYIGTYAHPLVTNNIVINAGMYCFSESNTANGDFGSLENNVCWSHANVNYFQDIDSTTKNAFSTVEVLTDWVSGYDKARGNVDLNGTTMASNPFVNVPNSWSTTGAAGTTTTINVTSQLCSAITLNEYIEYNNDGVARQVIAKTCGTQITIFPALASASSAGVELRYWGTRSAGGSQYVIDYHLAQNSMALGVFNNIRYGGKDTSGSNCGASTPAGKGVGTEGCGNVTADRDGVMRTTANAGLATNTSATQFCGNGSGDASNCNNPRSVAERAVPGGFSIGAYERE